MLIITVLLSNPIELLIETVESPCCSPLVFAQPLERCVELEELLLLPLRLLYRSFADTQDLCLYGFDLRRKVRVMLYLLTVGLEPFFVLSQPKLAWPISQRCI